MATFEEQFIALHTQCTVETFTMVGPAVKEYPSSRRRVGITVVGSTAQAVVFHPRPPFGSVTVGGFGITTQALLGTWPGSLKGQDAIGPFILVATTTKVVTVYEWFLDMDLEDLYREFILWKRNIEREIDNEPTIATGSIDDAGQDFEGLT